MCSGASSHFYWVHPSLRVKQPMTIVGWWETRNDHSRMGQHVKLTFHFIVWNHLGTNMQTYWYQMVRDGTGYFGGELLVLWPIASITSIAIFGSRGISSASHRWYIARFPKEIRSGNDRNEAVCHVENHKMFIILGIIWNHFPVRKGLDCQRSMSSPLSGRREQPRRFERTRPQTARLFQNVSNR